MRALLIAGIMLVAPHALALPVTSQLLSVHGGSSTNRLLDDLGSPIAPGTEVHLLGDLALVHAITIGTGIFPAIDTDGRFVMNLNLGNLENPTFPDGLVLSLASDSGRSLSTARYTISNSLLPSASGIPPLPITAMFPGPDSSSQPIPEPTSILLFLLGLGVVGGAVHASTHPRDRA